MRHILRWASIGTLLFAFGCKKENKSEPAATATPDQKTEAAKPESVTIALSCGSVANERELCEAGANRWAEKTGHKVKIISTPNDVPERLQLYQNTLSGSSADIDVYQIDVIWPAILQNHFIDLKALAKGAEAQHFPAIVENNTVDGKLLAIPWFTDAGLLYYRKDLLEKYQKQVPTTWEELTATAKEIQDAERKAGNPDMWGFVWQGKASESLTCNALEWIASHGGGTVVDKDGKISINNEDAAKALDLARSWVDTITPPGVLNYGEEDARPPFQKGNVVFMRNWPYAWSLAQGADSKIKDKVGVAALPKGTGPNARHAAALGGWQLAVSKYSKNPEVAADLVLFLTGPEEQKRRAIEGSFNPTIAELYKDADVLKANPFFGELFETFTAAVPRPSTATGDKYSRVSEEFYKSVHEVLSGNTKGKEAVEQIANKLDEVSDGGEW